MDLSAGRQASRLGNIDRVSPSRAAMLLSCPLAEAYRSGGRVPRLATHPKAHFGALVHHFFWQAGTGQLGTEKVPQLTREWARNLEDYERNLAANSAEAGVLPLSETCEDFEVNSIIAIRSASRIIALHREKAEGAKASGEVDIVDRDGLIAGRLDKIKWSDGSAVISDLKTGNLRDRAGHIRTELLIQLRLYAYLLHERDGVWPKQLRIHPLTGDPIDVEFSPEDAEELAAKVKAKQRELNAAVLAVSRGEMEESQLAVPAPSHCRFCAYRISCAAYWDARNNWTQDEIPPDVEGALQISTPQDGGYLLLQLAAPEGVTTIRGYRHSFLRGGEGALELGRPTRVCELRRERAPRTFSCRPITGLLQL